MVSGGNRVGIALLDGRRDGSAVLDVLHGARAGVQIRGCRDKPQADEFRSYGVSVRLDTGQFA